MARKPTMYYRTARDEWCVQIRGTKHRLGPDKEEAERQFHLLMARPPEPKVAAPPAVDPKYVVDVADAYFEWCQQNRSARTYEWQKAHVDAFCRTLTPDPASFEVAALKPFHVVRWANAHANWGPSQKRGAMGAVQRVFNWAEKLGLIERSPVRHIAEKPEQGRRDAFLTQGQFDEMLAFYKAGDPFRDLLVFCWETGARPQEAKILEARHFEAASRRFFIPKAEAKGKKRVRVIHLSDPAFEIAERLVKRNRTGPIFLNAGSFRVVTRDGETRKVAEPPAPWTAYAINCRFTRLKKKTGVKICHTLLRHSFCQRMLEGGLDSVTVAALMGHADAGMVQRVYSHMHKAHDYLAEQLKKVNEAG